MIRGYRHLLLTHLWVGNTQQKLLLFSALSSWQVGRQKRFERVRDLVLGDILDVLESFFSGSEWLIGSELDHLGESLKRANGFLNLAKLTAGSVEFLLLEKAIT